MFFAAAEVSWPAFLIVSMNCMLLCTAFDSSFPVNPEFLATSRIPRPISAICISLMPYWVFNFWKVSDSSPASSPSCFSVFSWAVVMAFAIFNSLFPDFKAFPRFF